MRNRAIHQTSVCRHPVSTPRWLYAILLLALLAGTVGVLPVQQQTVSAQAPSCVESSPPSGEYSVDVCLVAPMDNAVLSGTVPMTATVEPLSGEPPAVRKVEFYLSPPSVPLTHPTATALQAPYTLDLPTYHWVDGDYVLEARVLFSDDFHTPAGPNLNVTLSNDVHTQPGSDGSFTPRTSSNSPLHLVVVGNGGSGMPGTYEVATLANDLDPDIFVYLGDVYDNGTYTEFINYYEPTLGSLYDRTNPVVGNHEARSDYVGFMDYWNLASRYYSFDAGGWHIIALDTSQPSMLAPGTPQYAWLEADLAANAGSTCTMVMAHRPRFSLTNEAGESELQPAWALMDFYDVDIYLTAHHHNYQRWMPMNGAGEVDPAGITQIIVGTGGHAEHGFASSDNRVVYRQSAEGVLSLMLEPDGAAASFVLTDGSTPDDMSITCDDTLAPELHNLTEYGSGTILSPVADTRVASDKPTKNYGANQKLVADSSPEEVSYLRFEIPDNADPITAATLRFWVTNGTDVAPAVAVSPANDWDELTITWETRLPEGPVVAMSGTVEADRWLEYDVTGAVAPGDVVTFVLVPQSEDGMDTHSRENHPDSRPQLVIEPAIADPGSGTSEDPDVPGMNKTVTVATDGALLNCRSAPSADAAILAKLAQGTVITVRGEQEGDWIPVHCEGQEGYVHATLVVPAEPDDAIGMTPSNTLPRAVHTTRGPFERI